MRQWITLCESLYAAQPEPDDAAIERQDMAVTRDIMESAPPGKKAERFIRKHKKEFKRRYGKRGEEVLYATAWKKFGESASLRHYLTLAEAGLLNA